jgi:magnesium-transporting ATPase (P-type)
MNERLETLFDFNPSGALISSLFVMLIVVVLAIVVGIMAKKADPLKRPKGLLLLAEFFVEKISGFVKENMGENWQHMTAYFMTLSAYLFVAFIWSITGFPSIMDNIFAPLSLALVMWVIITFTAFSPILTMAMLPVVRVVLMVAVLPLATAEPCSLPFTSKTLTAVSLLRPSILMVPPAVLMSTGRA